MMTSRTTNRLRLIFAFLVAIVSASCGPFATSGGSGGLGPAFDGDAGPIRPYQPDAASDAGSGFAQSGVTVGNTAAAPSAQGNPLCNASYVGCYPDVATTAKACGLVPDGGVVEFAQGDGGAVLGCHVQATQNALAAPGPAVAAVCLPAGGGRDGSPCTRATDCAATYECVGAPGVCLHYCCAGNSACSSTEFCDVKPLAQDPSTAVPVCVPEITCALLHDATWCSPDETCQIVRENGDTSCVPIGPAQEGQSCDDVHCGQGLVCLGATGTRRCYTLCHTATATECTRGQTCSGGLQLFQDPAAGWCH
ncbi:MAG: hypothetical protein ACREJ3_06460 [Polyangiaceae bacterium]